MRYIGRYARRPIGALVAALAMVGIVTTACSAGGPRVALYGDSIADQSAPSFKDALGGRARVRQATVPGAALCDLAPLMQEDLQKRKPAVAVLSFSGNNGTTCISKPDGSPLSTSALIDRYESDARIAADALSAAGVKVVLAGSPRSAANDNATQINARYAQIARDLQAAGRDVSYVDTGAVVLAPDGSFSRSLPCQADEGAAQGCTDGTVVVRADDGVHLSPTGARRYGRAMADATGVS